MSLRVLHIAPHYGGGVGTVVRALVADGVRRGEVRHTLGCLEAAGEGVSKWAARSGIALVDRLHAGGVRELLAKHDLVHLHWWHHPLLNHFMHRRDLPAFRCVLWCHVNGHHAPQALTPGVLEYADIAVLATPWGLRTPAVEAAVARGRDIRVIQSNAAPPPAARVPDPPKAGIRVGYVGTVDPVKMHPDFVGLVARSGIGHTPIRVVGGPRHASLAAEAAGAGQGNILVSGPVDDVFSVLEAIDLFVYPLNPLHYGSGEQVLWEAMSRGVVPIVLGTGNEELILAGCDKAFVCTQEQGFTSLLHRAVTDGLFGIRKREVIEQYLARVEVTGGTADWHRTYTDLLDVPKSIHRIPGADDLSGFSLLIQGYAGTPYADLWMRLASDAGVDWLPDRNEIPLVFSRTRGTPFHYARFFAGDPLLQAVARNLERLSSEWRCSDWLLPSETTHSGVPH